MGYFVHYFGLVSACAVLVLFFQNCGDGFRSAGSKSLSSLCTSSIKLAAKSTPLDVETCQNIEEYFCERRVFSKDAENGVAEERECLASGDCLNVTTRYYSTKHVEDTEDYNRSEVFCAHSHRVRDVAVYSGEAETLEEAIALAVASCGGTR